MNFSGSGFALALGAVFDNLRAAQRLLFFFFDRFRAEQRVLEVFFLEHFSAAEGVLEALF